MADFWEVPQAAVVRIDRALLRHLRERGMAKRLMAPAQDYARQYLGFRRRGRQIIYINAMWARRTWITKRATTEFLKMCDGGSMAWGIEYDIGSKSFAGFQVNGNM